MNGMNGVGGSQSVQASYDAMQKMDRTMAQTTTIKAEADSMKLINDTMNSIIDGAMDSATKSGNAATKTAKSIQY